MRDLGKKKKKQKKIKAKKKCIRKKRRSKTKIIYLFEIKNIQQAYIRRNGQANDGPIWYQINVPFFNRRSGYKMHVY